MIKSFFIKIFSILFIFFIFSSQSFAENITNSLSEIQIETTENNIVNINLLFKSQYKEKAFLQKQEDGSYYVFLPNTSPVKNTKITYKNPYDKNIIRMTIEGKTAIKDDRSYSYTRITTDINKNYGIKLISKIKEKQNYLGHIIISLFAILSIFLLTKRQKRNKNITKQKQSFTHYPKDFTINSFNIKPIKETTPNFIIPKKITNKNTSFKFADKASFDCFNISQKREDNNTAYEFKSMLKQTSNALNNKITTITHKHSNPITRATKNDDSDLSIPSVADFFTPIGIEEEKVATDNVELISVLNITPNKGFYLTNLDDTIALFGFVNNNVFLFDRFKDLTQINLQARYYDKNGNNDIYIVRIDSFKAMIEISDTSMKELARI